MSCSICGILPWNSRADDPAGGGSVVADLAQPLKGAWILALQAV